MLRDDFYNIVVERLGREPNETEIKLFSAQWSEHCGYLHSKELLKREFKNTMQENAGYVKINGFCVVFKVESHNHPSAIEPYQGAATGIGGIVRDIIAMGARPIALLDSLRFGPLDESVSKNIFEGVVSGISDYGNSIGVPTVAGETYFDSSFLNNPLINVMCVGVAKEAEISSSSTDKDDVILVYVGSKTGKDGIHGASFASKKLEGKDDRPSVQVGDPFSEKNLIEATLEILQLEEVFASQDMGAAGLLSSTSEMAEKSKKGCRLHLDKVPLREEGMEGWEIMLSESQERMLFAVKKGCDDKIHKIAKKYFLDSAVIGELTDDRQFELIYRDKSIATLPLDLLVNAPSLYRNIKYNFNLRENYPKLHLDPNEVFLSLIKDVNITDKSWAYKQYDYKVGTNTVLSPGRSDASVLWLKGTKKGLAVTIDGNHIYSFLNPYVGTKNIVYEAARNLVAAGAIPLGITNNMNFGNPEKDRIMWQFERSLKGISDASKELKIPVVSGNVSFYNESKNGEIFPSPVIGMVGEVEDIYNVMSFDFKNPTDRVYLLGKTKIDPLKLGGSYYLKSIFGFVAGDIDEVDPEFELALQRFVLKLIKERLVNSVHDISQGGLTIAVLESALSGNTGFKLDKTLKLSIYDLFGENQSRFLVSIPAELEIVFLNEVKTTGLPCLKIGEVLPPYYGFDMGFGNFDLKDLKDLYFNRLKNEMEI